jgi:hypothetical protein
VKVKRIGGSWQKAKRIGEEHHEGINGLAKNKKCTNSTTRTHGSTIPKIHI